MFTVKINTDGSAFFGDDNTHAPGPELARILRTLAARIENDGSIGYEDHGEFPLIDINGNRCGTWHY